jgi:uncharacterized protein YbjT (DUF2867 family)
VERGTSARLIQALLEKGLPVYALSRPESVTKLPVGARAIVGNALDAATFVGAIPPEATFVHLVGTPHPSPAKAAEFQRVDLPSIKAAVSAARQAAVAHFVYISVAHPAPVMEEYIAVRKEGESLLRGSGIRTTVLRPWCVLGPGHWWPYLLVPVYATLRFLPKTREGAERLGLVTWRTMIAALVQVIENPPPETVRILDVPQIRQAGCQPM